MLYLGEQEMSQTKENKRAIIRFSKDGKRVLVLCHLGHLITGHKLDNTFGGSMFEADLSFREEGDRFDIASENCQGYGH